MARHRTMAAVGAVCVTTLLVSTLAGAATPKGHKPPKVGRGPSKISCNLVSPSLIQSTLGLTVGPPQVTNNSPVTVCRFSGSANPPSNVIVRFQTGETMATFNAEQQTFGQHGEPTTPVSGLGNAAFSSSIGAGSFTQNTIEVLKGSTTLLVTAPATLAQVQALVTQILPHL